MESKGYWYSAEDEIRFLKNLGKKQYSTVAMPRKQLLDNYIHYAKHLRTDWGNLDRGKVIEAAEKQLES